MAPFLLILFAVAVVVGCTAPSGYPTKGLTEYVIDDPLLAELFLEAAQEWTNAGVVAAASITVNVNPRGTKIKWSTPEDIAKNCGVPNVKLNEGEFISACTPRRGAHFKDTAWVTLIAPRDAISASSELRKRVIANIMHEQIHALLPTPEHLPPDQPGIMNSRGGLDITDADLDFISERTEVIR